MPNSDGHRLVVITGGPGAGKTTLIEALAAAGHAVMPEAGRAVIRAELAAGGSGLPWQNRTRFAELMVEADLCSHQAALALPGTVFFDRGVVDIAAYLELCGLPVPTRCPSPSSAAATARPSSSRRTGRRFTGRTPSASRTLPRPGGHSSAWRRSIPAMAIGCWNCRGPVSPNASPSFRPVSASAERQGRPVHKRNLRRGLFAVDTSRPGHHKSGRACRSSRE
ncbi:AAA family ATPase [Bosea sp. TND4EK4]|uniref:AAA family ATPase n=1 Tax=Bosea sp. TND4EK4 TaxID=1907408 RepID=UPI0032B02107